MKSSIPWNRYCSIAIEISRMRFTNETIKLFERIMTMKDQVEKALDLIRPSLMMDGGNVELVEVNDGVVKVRLTGACGGCPMSQMTLKMGIERHLKTVVPEVTEVTEVPLQ